MDERLCVIRKILNMTASIKILYSSNLKWAAWGDLVVTYGNVETEKNNGSYPSAYWQASKHKFEAGVDPHGLAQLYYYHDENNFYASFSLETLISLIPKPKLDYGALAVFYRMGSFVDNDTPFLGVKVLGPAGRIKIESGRINISESYLWSQKSIAINPCGVFNQYRELFSEAIREIRPLCENGAIIPLSGGRDSRHIFLEVLAQGINLKQVASSYFEPNNDFGGDVSTAMKLCSRADVELTITKNQVDWFSREKKKNYLTDFCTLQHAWYMGLVKELPAEGLLLDGLAGDVLSKPHKARYTLDIDEIFRLSDWDALTNCYLANTDSVIACFTPEIAERLSINEAAKRLLPALKKFSKFNNPQMAFEFYCRSRRNTVLSSKCLSSPHSVCYPYLNIKLFKYLSSLDPKDIPNNDCHTPVIIGSYPEFADIPFGDDSTSASYKIIDKISYKYFKCITLFLLLSNSHLARIFARKKILPRLLTSLFHPMKAGVEEWVGPQLVHMQGLLSLLNSKK